MLYRSTPSDDGRGAGKHRSPLWTLPLSASCSGTARLSPRRPSRPLLISEPLASLIPSDAFLEPRRGH